MCSILKDKYEEREEKAKQKGKVFTEELVLVPEQFEYQIREFVCTHGCVQQLRGDGERYQASTKFTGCGARLSAEAIRNPTTGRWRVIVHKEVRFVVLVSFVASANGLLQVTRHNHACDKIVFSSYITSSEIDDDALFNEAVSLVECDGKSKKMCDLISRRLGRNFTPKNLDNFKQYRLGGSSAVENMKELLERFASYDGSSTLLVEDEEGLLCGVVLQSAIQKATFQRWGDTLIMDWTHKTNNVGYYLGESLAR